MSLDLRALIISSLPFLLLVPKYQSRLCRVWRTSYCPAPGQIVSFWSIPVWWPWSCRKTTACINNNRKQPPPPKQLQTNIKPLFLHLKKNQFEVKMNLILFMHGYYLLSCIRSIPLNFLYIRSYLGDTDLKFWTWGPV